VSFPNLFSGVVDGFLRWLDRIAEDGLRRMVWKWFTALFGRRLVTRKLIDDEEVLSIAMHSWVAYVIPGAIMFGGVVFGGLWLWFSPVDTFWFPLFATLGVLLYGFYKVLEIARDRFVITDSRVFRVWGVFSLNEAEMEIVRVLDITVEQPWYLRMSRSGNLVLENAAQEQGLRKINLIPQTSERARVIHRRRRKMLGLMGDDDSGSAPTAPEPEPKPPPAVHSRKPRPVTARWPR
jgi:hypothetical protein